MQIKLFATYLLLNCLYLIKICVCSHITTMQAFVIDYEIKVMYFELYTKLYISSKLYINRLYMKIKKFFFFLISPVYKHLICIFAYTRNKKGTQLKKKKLTRKHYFFQNKPV